MTSRSDANHQGGLDRAAILGLIDGLERQFQQQLDALRALLAPEDPPSLEAKLRQLVLAGNPDLVTPEHAAQLMNVNVTTIYKWNKADDLLGHFVGGRLMISMSRLLERSKRPRRRDQKKSTQDLQTALQLLQTD
jgi:hypothetical protein